MQNLPQLRTGHLVLTLKQGEEILTHGTALIGLLEPGPKTYKLNVNNPGKKSVIVGLTGQKIQIAHSIILFLKI